MIKLLKNANVYTPSPIGKKDILIEGEKILRIADHIDGYENLPDVEIYDLNGKTVVPGYIDMHVHITGGGGEQGPASRVPESSLSVFFKNGITTAVGLLGTDGITRSEKSGGKGAGADGRGHDRVCTDQCIWLSADYHHWQRRKGYRDDPTDDRRESGSF